MVYAGVLLSSILGQINNHFKAVQVLKRIQQKSDQSKLFFIETIRHL